MEDVENAVMLIVLFVIIMCIHAQNAKQDINFRTEVVM